MTIPQSLAITPGSSKHKHLSLTPGSRAMQSPSSEEAIWRHLRKPGFDEDSIKRMDKTALIAYISKLEAEMFDHQHQMGLLLLERKELNSKLEQVKASSEASEIMLKRNQGAHSSAIAEINKCKESSKKALEVQKECVASLEKALHEMRAESAEMKVAAESKLAEARIMVEDSQKKFTAAEGKLHAAEALQAEANRYNSSADRKLKEVESREDDLRRRIIWFKSECEVKEKEIDLERHSLSGRQKSMQNEQKELLDRQALLNEREDYIFSRSQELKRYKEELEASKSNIQKELTDLNNENSKLKLNIASISKREEAVTEKEDALNKKESELLVLQEKLANKESEEFKKIIFDNETAIRMKNSAFEFEWVTKHKLMEEEIETKRRACELKELDLSQREYLLSEQEHDLETQSRALTEREKEMAERSNLLNLKENSLISTEREVELKQAILKKEKDEISKLKSELQSSLSSVEDKKKQVDSAKEELEVIKSGTNELPVIEMKLKEEIDLVRTEKLKLMVEADKLKVEKAKFEAEWELIDEKREELRKDMESVARQKQSLLNFVSDERESLGLEKDLMRDQHQRDVNSLHNEQEELMNKMAHERSEWFSKMQQEHADFLQDIEMQRRELEDCSEKRRQEIESSLRLKKKAFEQEKKNEHQYIASLKETLDKASEHVSFEMKRLENERIEINLDRERREKEWAELNSSIEELKVQREKLKKQRELLHADREEILYQIERLKDLEDMKISMDSMIFNEIQPSTERNVSSKTSLLQPSIVKEGDLHKKLNFTENDSTRKPDASSSTSAGISFINRYTELLFKHSSENQMNKFEERSLIANYEDASLALSGQLDITRGYALGEPKVILEVPPVNHNVGETRDSVDVKQDACGKSVHPVIEKGYRAGRKRRVESPPSDVCFDNLLEQIQQKKQRGVQKDGTVVNHCVLSMQANAPECRQAEDATVLIVDKTVHVCVVASEDTTIGNDV